MTGEVRRYDRPDGKQIVRLVDLEGGHFSFTVETEHWQGPEPSCDGYAYWDEVRGDGIFGSLAAVEGEIAARFPWVGCLNR